MLGGNRFAMVVMLPRWHSSAALQRRKLAHNKPAAEENASPLGMRRGRMALGIVFRRGGRASLDRTTLAKNAAASHKSPQRCIRIVV